MVQYRVYNGGGRLSKAQGLKALLAIPSIQPYFDSSYSRGSRDPQIIAYIHEKLKGTDMELHVKIDTKFEKYSPRRYLDMVKSQGYTLKQIEGIENSIQRSREKWGLGRPRIPRALLQKFANNGGAMPSQPKHVSARLRSASQRHRRRKGTQRGTANNLGKRSRNALHRARGPRKWRSPTVAFAVATK